AFFLIACLRCRRAFRTALPVEDEGLRSMLAERRLRRTVFLRRSDRVDAPVTYGVIRPVILFPDATDWSDTARLTCVLEHELTHIRRLDALWKMALALTACVHWFNPLVWAMYVLANRDMELRCDEAVVRRLGLDSRSKYALTLISMEEKKSGLGPFASAFSKNAIEERIIAIMKTKKRSIAAILAAVVLVCCVGVGFATSAAKDSTPYPGAQDGTFTKKELDRLASLWFEGYGDMTVAEYQQKMWIEFDTPEAMALIERYGQYSAAHPEDAGLAGPYQSGADGADYHSLTETTPSRAFYNYFHQVYEPLTAHNWQERTFSDVASARTEDGGTATLEYDVTMRILDPDVLTVNDYQRRLLYTKASMERLVQLNPPEDQLGRYTMLSSATPDEALQVSVTYSSLISDQPADLDAAANGVADYYLRQFGGTQVTQGGGYIFIDDPDAELHAQSSRESANQWDRQLTPYAPFGLTWEFNDPDLDGNGLTMWFQGREVRGIYDEQEGMWITEHTGTGFSDGAVELHTVYTDGKLSGLRLATAEEQAEFDETRQRNAAARSTISLGTAELSTEQREVPQATREDYDALLTLRQWDTQNESLESFNQRLLDWANANPDAWDRINCDVIWDDYGVELSAEEKAFIALTCRLSGTENGQRVRALYTGDPEQDPGWSRSLPMKYSREGGIVNAWCDLYYDISYHISDKSTVAVEERDACVSGMMNAIDTFWQDTDLETLLAMSEEDIVSQFNAWAEAVNTENVRFDPVTADNIHFEHADERGIG
nr:M56 family metallopeptidase [Oscillospiraceae bacterium]